MSKINKLIQDYIQEVYGEYVDITDVKIQGDKIIVSYIDASYVYDGGTKTLCLLEVMAFVYSKIK